MTALIHSSVDPAIMQDLCLDCPQQAPILAPGPRQVILVVTDRCNLRCPTCDYWRYETHRDLPELDSNEMFALIDELADLGVQKIVLTGGEPFLRRDILDICDHIQSWGMEALLLTNATLIGSSLAARIEALDPLRLIMSWDGWDQASFDASCGRRGTHSKVMRAFDLLCKECGIGERLGINITVTRHNLDRLEDIVRQAAGYGIGQLHLHLVYTKIGAERFTEVEVARIPPISNRLEDLARELGIPRVINQIPYAFTRVRHCYIPYSFSTIGSRGEVFGCIPAKGGFREDRDKALDNVRNRAFREIWRGSAYQGFRDDAMDGRHTECIACLACHAARNFSTDPCLQCAMRPEVVFDHPVGPMGD
jgi:MoaA/NifB/PqqE/SkfB family radical SAM enzyme